MRRYWAKKRGEAVAKPPKLTREERLERHRRQMAEFREVNRERLAQDRALRQEAMRDPAVKAAIAEALAKLTPPTNPGA